MVMELAQTLQQRTVLYRLLQELYTYPLSQAKLMPLLELESEDRRLEEGLALLRSVLNEVADWDAFLERLNVEYTRLFEGPGFVLAPPYASFYLNGGLLMGPETLAVRRSYLEMGVVPVRIGHIPDDHIALEMGFMGHLSSEAHIALTRKDDACRSALLVAQARFLSDHILTWVPRFCTKMALAGSSEFFVALSKLTQAAVEADAELINELIKMVGGKC